MSRRYGFMLLFVLAVLMVGFAIACSSSQDRSSSDSTSSAAAEDAAQIADNLSKVKSFKAAIDGAGGLQGVVEYEAPNKVHVTAGTGSTSQEVFCIGENFYVKPQGGPWQTVPSTTASCRSNLGPADPDALAASLKAVANVGPLKKGPDDSVGGRKCSIYTQTLPSGVEFGVCVADGLPLRIINKAAQGSVTITFSDFNKPLDLKAPI